MKGMDWGIFGVTVLIIVGGLLAILMIFLAFRRARRVLEFGYARRTKNVMFARLSYLFVILGLILFIAFWLGGGHNGRYVASAMGYYLELLIAGILASAGVILTFFVRLPRPSRKEDLNTKIVQHANVAWP